MGKKCILVSECTSGDVIAQKIVSKYGAIIAVENTVVNNYIKNKLVTFEIKYIWIYGTSKDESPKVIDATLLKSKKNYKENAIKINELINDLSKGKNINFQRIDEISNSIYSSINDEYYTVKWINELRSADEYSYNHSINVSLYGMLLSKWLFLSEREIKDVAKAGMLHDIGKTKVPIEILNKKGKLNSYEFEEIKKHPFYGYNIVKKVNSISDEVKKAILMHHERTDSSGYPMGINENELSLYSKIIAIVDVYDAITSERVYKKRETPFEAFQIFQNSNIHCFDIHIMNVFLKNLAACYVGSKVLLSNGQSGEIVYIPPHAITEPIISVDSKYIDLSKENSLKITAML
ncbi:HD-GYP domain-containing protein [Clostridium magnum]|uniref:Cyclic di-GMP phosphodiesterase response regulator RpfG n=1 Tax=Clostridium magnum DSM 2767 TaxID=1121326 RepID=A0A161YLU8_9CLOT|nr:HD-GYP domain-containing protein [Clostridium magnum]KZL91592.1 cyclic di-GMP phosphodiesterase response regulator RpfG [Clostridium magnum DSM 2767]SHH48813.1 HD-GYP domain, c-di-GMP phosphodiesterase class II (or its inactivated variant) [Clostridium magnum DSM 2767]